MFTRDVKNIVFLGKSHVLWNTPDDTWHSISAKYDADGNGSLNVSEVTSSGKNKADIKKDIETLNIIIKDGNDGEVEQAKKIKKTLEEGLKQIQENTNKNTKALRVEYKDETYAFDIVDKSDIAPKNMAYMIADLDHGTGVERSNRGWFKQAIFGGGSQKEVIGEAQVLKLLQDLDKAKLDALYQRITKNKDTLPWNATLSSTKTQQGIITQDKMVRGLNDLDMNSAKKIESFQRDLINEVNMVATLTEILLGQGARAGLRSVIDGNTDNLIKALQDPSKINHFKEIVAQSPELRKDKNFMVSVIAFLVKLGIQIPLGLVGNGGLMAFVESTHVTHTGESGGLKVKKDFGESASIGASADLIGVRIDGKWNDPTTRIINRTKVLTTTSEKGTTLTEIASKFADEIIQKDFPNNKDKKYAAAKNLADEYKNAIGKIPDSITPEQKKTLAEDMTMQFLSKIEALKGVQLEGVFAALNLQGAYIGLSGGLIDHSSTAEGVKLGAGYVEAEIGAKGLTEAQINKELTTRGIARDENGIFTDTKLNPPKILNPNGEKLVWKFIEVSDATGDTYDYEYRIVSTQSTTSPLSQAVQSPQSVIIKRDIIKNTTILADTYANYILRLRQTDPKTFTKIEEAITSGKYDHAKDLLIALLQIKSSKRKQQEATSMLVALNDPSNVQQVLDRIQSLSSGSKESRAIADKLESGKLKDPGKTIKDYYQKRNLYSAFAKQYGLAKEEVQGIIDTIAPTISKDEIRSMDEVSESIVAFNQRNGKGRFVALHGTGYSDTRYIGQLVDADNLTSVREKFNSEISTTSIEAYKQDINTALQVLLSDEEIKALIIDNEVPKALIQKGYNIDKPSTLKAFLSYEKNAECFNLGFTLAPPTLKRNPGPTSPVTEASIEATLGQGSVVNRSEVNHFVFGFGAGKSWNQMKDDNKTHNQPDSVKADGKTTPDNPITPPPTPAPDVPKTSDNLF